MGEHKVVPAHH